MSIPGQAALPTEFQDIFPELGWPRTLLRKAACWKRLPGHTCPAPDQLAMQPGARRSGVMARPWGTTVQRAWRTMAEVWVCRKGLLGAGAGTTVSIPGARGTGRGPSTTIHGIVSLPRRLHGCKVFLRPEHKGDEASHEFSAHARQFIVHFHRRAGDDPAGHVAVAFECPQIFGEDTLGNVTDGPFDRREPERSVLERQEDQRTPFAHHGAENVADGAEPAVRIRRDGDFEHTRFPISA